MGQELDSLADLVRVAELRHKPPYLFIMCFC
jgi:phosphatidylserine synthase